MSENHQKKRIVKHILALIALLAIAPCAGAQEDAAPGARKPVGFGIADGSGTTLGMKFMPPDEEGWSMERGGLSVTLKKDGALPGEGQEIEAYMITPDSSGGSIQEQVDAVKNNIQTGLAGSRKFRLVTLDAQADPGNARCVRGHVLLEDRQPAPKVRNKGKKWSEQYFMSCGFSATTRMGFEIRYSQRYFDGNGDEQFSAKADRLLGSVVNENP